MLPLVQQRLMLMLSMNINQCFRQLLHLLCSNRLPVYLADTFPCLHFPADNHRTVLRLFQFHLCQLLPDLRTIPVKHKLYQGAFRPRAKHIPVKFSPQRQIDASNQQGFSRSRLTGKNI